jgi:glycosyltransferase involved in cell wall biosynthesis
VAARLGRDSRVAPPPLDPLFHPVLRRRPRRKPWIAVAGIFEAEVKGVATALGAVERLRAGGLACRLLRLSALPLSPAEGRLATADLYLCAVPPVTAARALRHCDLLLFPSRADEGFGLPLLEAMASKVPAVASRIPSVEFIGGAARLVPVGDAGAMAAAAAELLADPLLWRQARQAGRTAAGRFAAERVGRELAVAVAWAASA